MPRNLFIRALLSLRKIDPETADRAERVVEAARARGVEDPTEVLLVKEGIVTKKDALSTRDAIEEVRKEVSLATAAADAMKQSGRRLADLAKAISVGLAPVPAPARVRLRRKRSLG